METLKIIGFMLLFAGIYGFISNDDYHKMFDKPKEIRYNCDMLIGAWHPDVPPQVIKECRERRTRI
jgi:hypothetical protein